MSKSKSEKKQNKKESMISFRSRQAVFDHIDGASKKLMALGLVDYEGLAPFVEAMTLRGIAETLIDEYFNRLLPDDAFRKRRDYVRERLEEHALAGIGELIENHEWTLKRAKLQKSKTYLDERLKSRVLRFLRTDERVSAEVYALAREYFALELAEREVAEE